MTNSKNTKDKDNTPVEGVGRIHKRPSGAVSVYAEKEIGIASTLPLNEKVKIIWYPEKEEWVIKRWGKN